MKRWLRQGTQTASRQGNVWTTVDGIKFQSKAEANRYLQLRQLEQSSVISNLRRQVQYDLIAGGILCTSYRADFNYIENGKEVVEDVKGQILPDFKIKYMLMKGLLGIEVRLVTGTGKPKALPYRYPKKA
jgi:hypothetical protein